MSIKSREKVMNPEKKRVNINTYKYIRSSYELEIVSGSVCRIFVLNIKNMNRLTLSILVTVMILTGNACKKINPDQNTGQTTKMEDLKVPVGFNWETSRNVDFFISTENSAVITITSEDGQIQYHKGFYNHLSNAYEVKVNLPAFIQKVLVNGEAVNITGNTINVVLSGNKQSGLKNTLGNQSYQIPLEGLLAAWHFDENSGTVANDLLGIHNGVVSAATWVSGISGSALNFDGVTGHVQVPNGGNFNPTGDKVSFSFWFKLSEVGANGGFVFQNVKYILKMDAQGRVSFALYTPAWKSIVMQYSDRILDTDWHHVAATYDGTTMNIYLDGLLKATDSNTGALQSSTSEVFIGNQNSINPFKGTMDEVLIYNRALTEAEITEIHTGTPDPGNGSGNLISSWNLDENSGNIAHDSKAINNGTITGATWGTGITGSCLNFNGINSNVNMPNTPSLNPVNELTMMAWAKTLENKTTKIFQKGDWDGHGIGQGKWDGWNVHIRLDNNVSYTIHWGQGLPIMNEWYHLAATYDGTTLKMYVNGQLKNSLAISGKLKVNTRAASIGSDNAAQKFFNGSIDEVKYFGKALSQTEIQANFTEQGSAPDQDGDGVPDAEDSYPQDPARAFNNYFPASGFGSLAFEDLWPGKGDYDFNDLVLDYRFTYITNASNKVTEIRGKFAIRAIGAGLSNGFGFQLPGTSILNADIEASGSRLLESYISLNANGTEASQQKTTIIVFDNVNRIMPPAGGFGVNVVPGAPYVKPDTTTISILFTPNKYSIDDIGLVNFNPFLIVNKERGKEIHLPDYPPTSLVNMSYFGTGQDNSDPNTGRFYKTGNNLPWAINIVSSYDYTIEANQITSGYLKFAAWAESGGTLFPDWYLNNSGYRNAASIYQVP